MDSQLADALILVLFEEIRTFRSSFASFSMSSTSGSVEEESSAVMTFSDSG